MSHQQNHRREVVYGPTDVNFLDCAPVIRLYLRIEINKRLRLTDLIGFYFPSVIVLILFMFHLCLLECYHVPVYVVLG